MIYQNSHVIPDRYANWWWSGELFHHYSGDSAITVCDTPERLYDGDHWYAITSATCVNDFMRKGGNHVELSMWVEGGYIELDGDLAWTEDVPLDDLIPFLRSIDARLSEPYYSDRSIIATANYASGCTLQ